MAGGPRRARRGRPAARLDVGQKWDRPCLAAGVAVTGAGIALRQWAIATLGQYFVGHELFQPGQTVISTGPYRWLRRTISLLRCGWGGVGDFSPPASPARGTPPARGSGVRVPGGPTAISTPREGAAWVR